MRNKPYVAVAAVPAVLLFIWAVSLWWRENGIGALIAGGIAAALFVAAYRIAKADSFAPGKSANWSSMRSAGVADWIDAREAKGDQGASKR
jgi:hypothetical protein